jgi:hypothetical protein
MEGGAAADRICICLCLGLLERAKIAWLPSYLDARQMKFCLSILPLMVGLSLKWEEEGTYRWIPQVMMCIFH